MHEAQNIVTTTFFSCPNDIFSEGGNDAFTRSLSDANAVNSIVTVKKVSEWVSDATMSMADYAKSVYKFPLNPKLYLTFMRPLFCTHHNWSSPQTWNNLNFAQRKIHSFLRMRTPSKAI